MSDVTEKKTAVKNGNYSMENVRSMVRQMGELDGQIEAASGAVRAGFGR